MEDEIFGAVGSSGNGGGQQGGQDGAAGSQGQQQGNQDQQADNSGGDADLLAGFWDADESGESEQGGQRGAQQNPSTQTAQPAQNQTQTQGDATAALRNVVEAMQIPDIMTDDVMTQLANNDTKGFNDSIKNLQRNVSQQTLTLTGQMLQAMHERIIGDVKKTLSAQFDSRDNMEFLDTQLPRVDATAKPVVQALFQRALVRTKGNKEKAAIMTKQMLGRLGIASGSQSENEAQARTAQKIDWAKELGLTADNRR